MLPCTENETVSYPDPQVLTEDITQVVSGGGHIFTIVNPQVGQQDH